jgi:hypothetical protein
LSQECLAFSKSCYIFGKLEESGKGVQEKKRFRQDDRRISVSDLGVLFVVYKSGKDETCVRVISAEDLVKQKHLNRENVLKL